MIRAGRLRHRVAIMVPGTGKDATGAPSQTPTLLATVWGEVGFVTGRERWANEYTVTNYDVVITVRFRSDLKENMIATHNGRTFEIKNIIDPEMNQVELKLLCVDKNGL